MREGDGPRPEIPSVRQAPAMSRSVDERSAFNDLGLGEVIPRRRFHAFVTRRLAPEETAWRVDLFVNSRGTHAGVTTRRGSYRPQPRSTGAQSTSSIRAAPLASMTRRSTPSAMPALSGMPWASAARKSSSIGYDAVAGLLLLLIREDASARRHRRAGSSEEPARLSDAPRAGTRSGTRRCRPPLRCWRRCHACTRN